MPWVRSPQLPPFVSHYRIRSEFKRCAEKTSKNVELDTPLDRAPDIIGGLVIPQDDNSVVFLAHDNSEIPAEHMQAVQRSQQLLSEHDINLHAHLGGGFIEADADSP